MASSRSWTAVRRHGHGSTSMTSSMSPSMDDDGLMTMEEMAMAFFTSYMTPLYSESWVPTTMGQYAGTCVFLIVFAALFRGILAVRSNFDFFVMRANRRQGGEVLRLLDDDKNDFDPATQPAGSSRPALQNRPWRINEALARAGLDTVLAGVGYLLMIAVMTMNVGYFMSVLGGVFLGSFIIGGYAAPALH